MSTHADMEVFMDMMGDDVETPYDFISKTKSRKSLLYGLRY